MSWEIVVGIFALVGAFISIGTIISNNTKAMTEVKCSIDSLNATVVGQGKDLKDVKNKVDDHEKRIIILEFKEEV